VSAPAEQERHVIVEGNENLREDSYCEACEQDWPCETETRRRDRRYNEATTHLDIAIRYLNQAKQHAARGDLRAASHQRDNACPILERYADFLTIDQEAIL